MSAGIITGTDYLRAISDGDGELVGWYGAMLDAEADAERQWYDRPDAVVTAALSYVTRGLRVFPLTPGTKVPLPKRMDCCGGSHRRGCLDALADVAAVRAWWREHPTANVGVATGHLVDVIDQDGTDGAVSWCRDQWPTVLGVVSSPRAGGVHRYVAATGLGNGQRIAPGLDYRGRGGYVVAPPSIVDGQPYTWVQPLVLTDA